MVKKLFLYVTMIIKNSKTDSKFKVNGQRLKYFIKIFDTQEENLHFLSGDVQKG